MKAAAADCAIAGSPVTGFPGAGFATASDSDTGVSSELVNTNVSFLLSNENLNFN